MLIFLKRKDMYILTKNRRYLDLAELPAFEIVNY